MGVDNSLHKHLGTNAVCPECGSKVTYREGRYGEFVGYTNYPDCKWSTSLADWDSCESDPEQWKQERWYKNNDPTNEILNG